MNLKKLLLWFILLGQLQFAKADTFRILDDEKESLQCRIDMTVGAQRELLISTYIIRLDEVGLGLLQLMVEKAAQGVKVRLILDAMHNDLPRPLIKYLLEKNVEIRMYNKVRFLEFHTIIDRMHEKVLISDINDVIVGGRNMSKDYYKLDSISNFKDREMYAHSQKVGMDLRNHFYLVWNHNKLTNRTKYNRLDDNKRAYWREQLANALASLIKKTGITTTAQRDWTVNTNSADIHATYDNFVRKKNGRFQPFDRKDRNATKQLIALIDSAKSSIDFENPYFHPTRRWEKALNEALKRGVKIRLVTNSECTNDVLLMQAVYRRSRHKYLKMGIQIWEYEGKECLHTKSIVIDSIITVIGSYNIHIVSEKNNTEVCLWVKDAAIGNQSIDLMNGYLASSKNIAVTKTNLSKRLIGYNEACRDKRLRYCLYVRLLAPFLSLVM